MNAPLVQVNALWVRFGPVDAVRGIDLSVPAGTATALLGRNGAGKSTTMRVLAGVIPPTGGVVTVDGHDIRDATPSAVKRVTGYCPDVGGLVPRATPVGAPPARRPAAPARPTAGRTAPGSCSSASTSAPPRTG